MLVIVTGGLVVTLYLWPRLASVSGVRSPATLAAWVGGIQMLAGAGLVLGYGFWKLAESDARLVSHPLRIALIQGAV